MLAAAQLCFGCGTGAEPSDGDIGAGEEQPAEEALLDGQTENSDQVASEDEMASKIQVLQEGMTPIDGTQVKDGTYEIQVDSSSSMFRITQCTLTVKDGKMTAVMTMGGTGYRMLFLGTGEQAVQAAESEMIPFIENEDGAHTYQIPVEALDAEIFCSAFSKKKEKWYDRTLVFRADSLPLDAFADGTAKTPQSLGLADGSYTVEVTLGGGSGKASVESPALLRIADGKAYATITFSSPNYDYMKIKEEMYQPVNTEGNSTFEIPVEGFDWKLAVIADTIAMSEPHEIDYTLYFDASSIKKEGP